MSEFNQTLLIILLTRLLGMICGAGFAFLGYKLFLTGYFEKASELNAVWGKQRLVLKQIAPGAFFALLGVAVTWVTSQHQIQVSDKLTHDRALAAAEASTQKEILFPPKVRLPLCDSEVKASALKLRTDAKISRNEAHQLADCAIEAIETDGGPIIDREVRERLGYTRYGEVVFTIPKK